MSRENHGSARWQPVLPHAYKYQALTSGPPARKGAKQHSTGQNTGHATRLRASVIRQGMALLGGGDE